MYGRIHRGITFKSCKLCKILPAVLQVEPANTIISRPFLKNWDGYVSLANYYIVAPLWRLSVCWAVAPDIFPHNLLNVQKSVIVELANHKNWTYLFLKQQVDKKVFMTKLQVYGITFTRPLNFVGM